MQVIVQLRVCRWEVGFVGNVGASAAPEAQFGGVGEFVGQNALESAHETLHHLKKKNPTKKQTIHANCP